MADLEKVQGEYLWHLEKERNLSAHTVRAYVGDLESFIGNQFQPGERDIAYALWADDEAERTFTPIEGSSDFYIDLRSDLI